MPVPPAVERQRRRRRRLLTRALIIALGAGAFGLYGLFLVSAPSELQLSGRAYLAKPLTGATVEVYEMKSNGDVGTPLATTTTDKNGAYTVSVQRSPSTFLLVRASGGSYLDTISKKGLSAGQDDSLQTVLSPGATSAPLTPLTTFAAARASSLAASGKPLGDSVEVSFAAIARQFNLETITDIDPAITDDPASVQISGRSARQYGLILVGLDQEANTLGVSDFALSDALAQDIGDGKFDGKAGATPVLISKTVPLPADAATAKLQDAISKVAASPSNVTHLPAPQVSLQTSNIDLNTAGLSYISPTILPAWIDGQAGSVTIVGKGGTPPYACEIVSGDLPAGFSLSSDCTISGNGTPILGIRPLLISAPFVVKMSDTSAPPQSLSVELRITIMAKPPIITPLNAVCPKVGQGCSVAVASAKGGTQPYYFTSGSFANGTPPMGMSVGLNGMLSGVPTRAGPYHFEVCVVDLVGAMDCGIATVVVEEASPSPTQNNLPSGFPTNLPAGNYDISVCVGLPGVLAPYSSCADAGTHVISGDASSLAQAIAQAADAVRSSCTCTVHYTTFNGTYFDFVITDTNTGTVTRIHVTKVG